MATNSDKTTNADHQRKWKEQNKGTIKLENFKYQVNQLSKRIEDMKLHFVYTRGLNSWLNLLFL